ncbi:MAG: alpha/beta hydrolase [Planctomycetes bacterium]|nr:alpha/beta hydrolase [Planctomycetota bacterium]
MSKALFLTFISSCSILLLAVTSHADLQADKVLHYKTVERKGKTYELKLHVFNPKDHKTTAKAPCIAIFHSGGWSGGTPSKYFKICALWARHNMVAISVEYSIRQVHNGTPFDSVADAKSAIRWIRSHADELGIDPDRIAAGGGSAGAHVAAAAALLSEFDEKNEDQSVSSKPNALVLRSPVIDNGPDGYGYKKVKARWKEFSPVHNVSKGAPPTILFVGSEEGTYISTAAAKKFRDDMKAVGSRCELHIYEGEKHGCKGARTDINEKEVNFLISLGYIKS